MAIGGSEFWLWPLFTDIGLPGLYKTFLEVCRGVMSEPVIVFDHVSKSYPLYHHMTGGIKNFLFNLP
jgi:hypothetical protein